MMWNETMPGAEYERLTGGAEVVRLTRNVVIGTDTTVLRGALLAGLEQGTATTVHWATSADASNDAALFIGAESVSGETLATVYESGRFNRGGLILQDGVSLTDFELPLRRQNIILTEVI